MSPAARGPSAKPSSARTRRPPRTARAPIWLLWAPRRARRPPSSRTIQKALAKALGEQARGAHGSTPSRRRWPRWCCACATRASSRPPPPGDRRRSAQGEGRGGRRRAGGVPEEPRPRRDPLLVSAENPGEMDRKIAGDQRKKPRVPSPSTARRSSGRCSTTRSRAGCRTTSASGRSPSTPRPWTHLLDMVENNTRDMRVECERLALFFGPGATIDAGERRAVHLPLEGRERVHACSTADLRAGARAAEEVLDKILLSREAEPTQLAGGLLWQFRKLAGSSGCWRTTTRCAEALPKLRIISKKNQKTYTEGDRQLQPPPTWRRSSSASRVSTSGSGPSGPTCTRFFCA